MLGFDCGGQQWVLEVAFPTGTLKYALAIVSHSASRIMLSQLSVPSAPQSLSSQVSLLISQHSLANHSLQCNHHSNSTALSHLSLQLQSVLA